MPPCYACKSLPCCCVDVRDADRALGAAHAVFEGRPEQPREARVSQLLAEKSTLLAYARAKLDAQDYHAVADAAMDLREISAKLDVLEGRGE